MSKQTALRRMMALRNMYEECDLCDLCENRIDPATGERDDSFQMFPHVGDDVHDGDALVMLVVGQADAEFFYESPLEAESGLPLRFMLEVLGVRHSEAVVTTLTLCNKKVPQSRGYRQFRELGQLDKPPPGAIKACFGRVLEEIRIFRPAVIIACGSLAYSTLTHRSANKIEVEGMIPLSYAMARGQMLYVDVPGDVVFVERADDEDGEHIEVGRTAFRVPLMTTYSIWEMLRRVDGDNPEGVWSSCYKHMEKLAKVMSLTASIRGGRLSTLDEIDAELE